VKKANDSLLEWFKFTLSKIDKTVVIAEAYTKAEILKSEVKKARSTNKRGRIGTVDFLVLTSLLQPFFCQVIYLSLR